MERKVREIFDKNGQPQYRIPEVLNWEDYKYSPFLECSCKKVDVINSKTYKYIVGICYTPHGIMACYECPDCGERLRWHIGEDDLKNLASLRSEWRVK